MVFDMLVEEQNLLLWGKTLQLEWGTSETVTHVSHKICPGERSGLMTT
jgi:hypothetical protein